MKVKPADFFMKPPCMFSCLWILTASWAQAQNYQPAAVQQPVYRQSGSAYVPPSVKRTPQQPRLPAAPANSQGYQPGFGTPQSYRPPTVKGNTTASKPKGTAPSSKSKPASLEHKVARLERNDVLQDRRLNNLDGGGTSSRVVERGSHEAASPGKHYTVRKGDTLWRIADKHNTSINALKSANRLSSETISTGQTLLIPGHGESAPSMGRPSAAGSHVVRQGETFSQIARSHGVSQDALARANPAAYPDRLLIGEKLMIPGGKSTPVPSYEPPANSPAATLSSRAHVVKRGESLGAIAKSYGIPTATLASANKLKNANLIEPGQRLIIPSGGTKSPAAPSAPIYNPVDTDTQPLNDRYLATAPAAPLAPSPSVAPEPAPKFPAKSTAPASSSNRRGIVAYRLERGDDISTVAALFNTTPDTIRELNKLPPDKKLKEGDEVVVPALAAVSLN